MDPVHLYSRAGAFLTTMYLPAMILRPDVVFWGLRTFVKHANGSYHEAFVWTLQAARAHVPASQGHGHV